MQIKDLPGAVIKNSRCAERSPRVTRPKAEPLGYSFETSAELRILRSYMPAAYANQRFAGAVIKNSRCRTNSIDQNYGRYFLLRL